MKLCQIIVNVTRGLFDGHYANDMKLKDVTDYWREQFPGDRIIVVTITSGDDGGIPDHLFMARYLHAKRQLNEVDATLS